MEIRATEAELAAARAYEALHVPALFQQFAPLMVAAAGLRPGQRVLDVACGTGILAREAAVCLEDPGAVTGLDCDAGMLAVAGQLAPAIRWRRGRAEALPFDDGQFDAVLCQFGLMFFPDPKAAVGEMARVLVTGGRLAVGVWDVLEHSRAYGEAVGLLERLAGKAAADALRAPFSLGDREALRRLLSDAGMTGVELTTHRGRARFPSIRAMVEADLRGWLPVMGVVLEEALIDEILQQAEQFLGAYRTVEGAVVFEVPAHIVTGVK